MSRIHFLALTACLFALALTAPATHPSPIIDPRLETQLVQIDAAASEIKDLSAHFEQDKFTALLKKPLVSTGTVRTAGSVIRWDTEQPEACSLYADQAQLLLYYPTQKLEEIYPIDQRMGDLMSSPLPRLKTIEKHFAIEQAAPGDLSGGLAQAVAHEGALALRLTPSDPALARHIRQVIVVLDIKSGLTLMVRTIDSDGDQTEIFFSGTRTNTGLQAGQLELKVPGDTTLSHPLDSAPGAQSPNGSP